MTLFEDQIKHYRKQAGLSQEKMAEKIGVSRQAITKWENGTGTPDISNLMAIANLFQISIDELLANEKTEIKKSEYIYESRTEYDIDGKKDFDIKLGGAYKVDLKAYNGEKIVVELFSNVYKNIQSDYKVKIDDNRHNIDIELARLNGVSEAIAKESLIVNINIPAKYIGRVEISVNTGALTVTDTSRLIIPENFCFRSAKKGIANTIYYEKYGKKVESFSNDESDNYIELNGIKSELVIAIDEA